MSLSFASGRFALRTAFCPRPGFKCGTARSIPKATGAGARSRSADKRSCSLITAPPPKTEHACMALSPQWRQFWRYVRALSAPVLLWASFWACSLKRSTPGYRAMMPTTRPPSANGSTSRGFSARRSPSWCASTSKARIRKKPEEIEEQLRSLADPTRQYQGQLPLFPTIYRMELVFSSGKTPELAADCLGIARAPRPRRRAGLSVQSLAARRCQTTERS